MDDWMMEPAAGITRRDAMRRVAALMGGIALVATIASSCSPSNQRRSIRRWRNGVGAFTSADVALLDEIAETILPETSDARREGGEDGRVHGADGHRRLHRQPTNRCFARACDTLDDACRAAHSAGFLQATPAQRLPLLEALDREQKTATEERTPPARTRAPARRAAAEDMPAHYFRMMKELALLGYFTSEIGYTAAMRYVESPGRFDPDVPCGPDDTSWAPHA